MTLPWWFICLFLPDRARRQCEAAGTHRPVLIDLGRDKRCPTCGQH